ncbi:DNA-directed RNA polymerase subunit omega [bacterium]|nr:MAG: DNA-directed RNA polymerase subunit omega [bacterium]
MNRFGNIDSKFRFVILASKRAKQLLKGAKPKIKTKSKNPIRIAQIEARSGLVEYAILPTQKEEFQEQEDRVFIAEGLHDEGPEVDEGPVGKADLAPDEGPEVEVDEEVEKEGDDETEDERDVEGEKDE